MKSKGNRVYFEASFVKLVYAIPVQLIAYCIAVMMGKDVDQPRMIGPH
jgi:glucosamine 6-phosphate synthetase-like amidotransferase/phosphosugar isomerase protein